MTKIDDALDVYRQATQKLNEARRYLFWSKMVLILAALMLLSTIALLVLGVLI